MKKVRLGVVNYYNPGDGLLSTGTVLMGNVDGVRDAGARTQRISKFRQ